MKKIKKLTLILLIVTISLSFTACAWLDNIDKSLSPRRSDEVLAHLISNEQSETVPIRRVDSSEILAVAFESPSTDINLQIDELYDIVISGKRPILDNVADVVKNTYNNAIEILNKYLLNSFSDYEKVHAIHDYLTYYIVYDWELYERYLSNDNVSSQDPSFNINGVFLNKSAVCDGISKAFVFLCRLEGIESVRILGEYIQSEDSVIPHAWNKVNLDGKWYNVDATMDSEEVSIKTGLFNNKPEIMKIIHHGYFLISDMSIKGSVFGKHSPSDDPNDNPYNIEAKTDYEFYSITDGMKIADKQYKMEITNQEDLNALFAGVKKSNRVIGKFEVKLNFAGIEANNINSFELQLKEAYENVRDKDFKFEAESGKYPYLRYPNGVFLMLIYK